jgi:hypothetical protein
MAESVVNTPFSRIIWSKIDIVISGFNTDIKVGNTVYHVQTEDKGLKTRLILSLVYDKGTILASKRVHYDDLANGAFDEKELAERLNRQHQLICAAVKAGRIDELKEMTGKERTKNAKAAVSEPEIVVAPVSVPVVKAPPAAVPEVTALNVETARIAASKPYSLEPVIEAVAIIEEEIVLDAGAVEVVSELSGQDRPTNNKLSIELLGESKFKGGDRRTVNIMVCRGTERKVVAGAEIMLKVLGSSFRPVIFHARSDANGLAKIHMQLPHFDAGRAALLIRAIAAGEEIELRRVVTPG